MAAHESHKGESMASKAQENSSTGWPHRAQFVRSSMLHLLLSMGFIIGSPFD
jgi:hypothetical protein